MLPQSSKANTLPKQFFRMLNLDFFYREENTDAHDEWESYKKKFGKSYADEEDERLHMEIFHESLRKIVTHNKLGTFKLALNHFSDVVGLRLYRDLNR
ncbi:hypothetical protein PMAYCL1PPCAC_22687 [Pristionchus mayeri]|uniref:Cathepsin propeptide inhibitor domain-containing protein n=1 Tax=Pristionchus mayeri TaxID=1317129 RepID=A0AAN5CYP6_9BILA|nr:hypothetical protein PMAYCL1PPCAC_22687 [Pristionchus mayeri]